VRIRAFDAMINSADQYAFCQVHFGKIGKIFGKKENPILFFLYYILA
jgi:hypothetical protein